MSKRKLPNAQELIFILTIAALTVSNVLDIWLASHPSAPETPVYYLRSRYLPEKRTYCPGETLTARYQTHYPSGTTLSKVAETIADAENGVTAVPDHEWSMYIQVLTAEHTFDGVVKYALPDLPPGKYEYRRAVETAYSKPFGFVVPFEVPEGCK